MVMRFLLYATIGAGAVGAGITYHLAKDVTACSPPANSLLNGALPKSDFMDCYQYPLHRIRFRNETAALEQYAKGFFVNIPDMGPFLRLRTAVYQLLGIEHKDPHHFIRIDGDDHPYDNRVDMLRYMDRLHFREGDGIAGFRVMDRREYPPQLLFGGGNRFLDYRILLNVDSHRQEDGKVTTMFRLGTVVQTHSAFAWLYLIPILPVHFILSRVFLVLAARHALQTAQWSQQDSGRSNAAKK